VEVPAPESEEGVVLAALSASAARSQDDVTASTGLEARAVSRALTGLELEGLVVLLPGRSYVRSSLADELMLG